MSTVPSGGAANINGVLYQMLWTLLRTLSIRVLSSRIDDANGTILEATVCSEPSGGGGDVQENGPNGRVVYQLKAKSDEGPWSLKEVVEEVLPDLYLAVDQVVSPTAYRLVTEGHMGQWQDVMTFFASLREMPYSPDSLDDSTVISFGRHPGRPGEQPFWDAREYTRTSLFEKIVATVRKRPQIANKDSLDESRQKLWTLLGHFDFWGDKTQQSVQQEVDAILLAIIASTEAVEEKRNALLGELLSCTAAGNAELKASEIMAKYGLDSIPLTHWPTIRERGQRALRASLERLGYLPDRDVRSARAQELTSSWPDTSLILAIQGDSGQGKSWLLYAMALAAARETEVVVMMEAKGDLDKDLETAANCVRSYRDGVDAVPLDRVGRLLRSLHATHRERWLTLLIDGIQDHVEARALAQTPWKDWGIRVVLAGNADIIDAVKEYAGLQCTSIAVSDFTWLELQNYLTRHFADRWPRIPNDIRHTLRRPLLAYLFADIVSAGGWAPTKEYELYDAFWKRLLPGRHGALPTDAANLGTLAATLLDNRPYPWSVEQLQEVRLDGRAILRLQKLGWLRRTDNGLYEIWHNRLLNWAVAEGLVSRLRAEMVSADAFLTTVRTIAESPPLYRGHSLSYLPMDAVWLLATRYPELSGVVERLMVELESLPAYANGLYRELLPSVGAPIVPALMGRLQILAKNDHFLLGDIVGGIVGIDSPDVTRHAISLLHHQDPLLQRAGMRILAARPNPEALDTLWPLHCLVTKDPQRFHHPDEHQWAAYEDSFGAVKACSMRRVDWLATTIMQADATHEPVHDLAYILADLNPGRKDLWLQHKSALFSKVRQDKERCLAANIRRYRDETEITWLLDRIPREDDALGPACLQTLVRIAPDTAVDNIRRLAGEHACFARSWYVDELLVRRPDATRAALLGMIKASPSPWTAAMVYQGSENQMDVATLEFLLEQLQDLLQRVTTDPPPGNVHPLWRPLSMLATIVRLPLLLCLEGRRGARLERLLADWLLSRGPRRGIWADHEGHDALEVLYKIGGDGFTRVINSYLGAASQYGRIDGLQRAAKRPDSETLRKLREVAITDHLWDGHFPLEQGEAALAMCFCGIWDAVSSTIRRWGLKTTRRVCDAVRAARHAGDLDTTSLSSMVNLTDVGRLRPGDLMLLGLLGVSRASTVIAGILEHPPSDPDTVLACIIALGDLQHVGEKAQDAIGRHLKTHAFVATNALLSIGTELAVRILLKNIQETFALDTAVALASHPAVRRDALALIVEHLETDRRRLAVDLPLIYGHAGDDILNFIGAQDDLRESIREIAFAEASGTALGNGKTVAIRCLAGFDRDAAFLAAKSVFCTQGDKGREECVSLLLAIDAQQALEVLLARAATEDDLSVVWAIGRGLASFDLQVRLSSYLAADDPSLRLAGSRLLPWQSPPDTAYTCLLGLLDDPSLAVARSAQKALRQLQNRLDAMELSAAFQSETNPHRRWVLLDSLLNVADPGGPSDPWPEWAEDLAKNMPYLWHRYLGARLKERREEMTKQLAGSSL